MGARFGGHGAAEKIEQAFFVAQHIKGKNGAGNIGRQGGNVGGEGGELLLEKVKMYADDVMLREMTGKNKKKFAVYDTLDRIYDIVCGLTK